MLGDIILFKQNHYQSKTCQAHPLFVVNLLHGAHSAQGQDHQRTVSELLRSSLEGRRTFTAHGAYGVHEPSCYPLPGLSLPGLSLPGLSLPQDYLRSKQ
ncbi:rCG26318 [Rattus norvegicus]|uniref:RCG26318 n=1 Tax=Rattus norvegicus TaxID=10116 RepID=A6HMJ6_RAT|nr:rCG26318 [Rattus norvegicus]